VAVVTTNSVRVIVCVLVENARVEIEVDSERLTVDVDVLVVVEAVSQMPVRGFTAAAT
jgi:hypothetical protein